MHVYNISKRCFSIFLAIIILFSSVQLFSESVAAASGLSLASSFSPTQNCIDLIFGSEGCRTTCYQLEGESFWTIGYGTRCTGLGHESGVRHTITKEEATNIAKTQILGEYKNRVVRDTPSIYMNQNQFDALVSLAYNHGNVCDSCPLVFYLQGKLTEEQARTQIESWFVLPGTIYENGLRNRRRREANLFFTPCDTTSYMTISDQTVPTGSLKQGANFGIYGIISSNLPITKVWGGIYKQGTDTGVQTVEDTPNATSYNLHGKFNNNLIFDNLAVGNYTYKIYAKDSQKTYTLINSNFSVGTPLVSSMTISDQTIPSGALELGANFGIYGIISSNLPITKVWGGIYKQGTDTGVQTVEDTPNATSYNLHGKFNNNLIFNNLEVGNYTYKIYAKDAEKTYTLINSDFQVGEPSTIEFNASASSISINGYTRESVIFSYNNYNGTVSLSWEHGENSATILDWGEWTGNTVPLIIEGYATGTEVIKVYLKNPDTEEVLATQTITVSVTGIEPEFYVTSNSISISMDDNETKNVTFSYAHVPTATETVNIRWVHGTNTATSLEWGEWVDGTCKLYITGYRTGTEDITVELFDSDTDEVLAKQVITVNVTGTPKMTASTNSVILDYNEKNSKDVKISMSNFPYGCSLLCLHGDETVTSYEWNGWDNGTNTLTITPTAPGTEILTVQLLSSTDEVILSTQIDVTVTAKFNVTFDANGGSCDPTSKTVTYDSTYGELPELSKTGYVFKGWYTAESGGTQITKDSKVTITADQTLYAHWELNTYTVTLDANGGSLSDTSVKVTYSKGYGTLPPPELDGYTFDGWFTEPDGGVEITASTIVTTNKNHTLYAHWTKIPETTTTTTTTTSTTTTTTTTTTSITTTDASTEVTTTTTETTTEPIETLPPEDAPQIVVGTVNGKPGEVVEVSVELRNNPGILAAGFEIEYDAAQLKLIEVLNGELMAEKTLQSGDDLTAMPYTVFWSDAGGVVETDGVLVVFRFEIAEDASDSLIPVTLHYDPNQTFDDNLENISLAVVDGVIEIDDNTDGLLGDVNKDGFVDLKDVVLIRRYIAGGWDVTIDVDLADVNADDFVDLKDVVLIRRFIAGGWDVTFG